MKAVVQKTYGGPEVLHVEMREKPRVQAGTIVIRNRLSIVSAADMAFRSGSPFIARFFSGLLRPKVQVPGDVFCGEIAEVGAGVSGYAVGDQVYGLTFGAEANDMGALAEYVAVRPGGVLRKLPKGMSPAEAVSLLDGGLTAISFMKDHGEIKQGTRLLVNGASSVIGATAMQIARHWGAEVTGVCSGRNVELAQKNGAHHVIDYEKGDFTKSDAQYDVVFDAVGKSSFGRVKRVLTANGKYLTTVPSFHILLPMLVTNRFGGKTGKLATTGLRPLADKMSDLDLMDEMWAQGVLVPPIDRRFALSDIVSAHAYVQSERKTGSVVIDI